MLAPARVTCSNLQADVCLMIFKFHFKPWWHMAMLRELICMAHIILLFINLQHGIVVAPRMPRHDEGGEGGADGMVYVDASLCPDVDSQGGSSQGSTRRPAARAAQQPALA